MSNSKVFSDFTFDPSLVEKVGSTYRLKSQISPTETYFIPLTSDLNALRGASAPIATVNSPAIVDGKLDLSGGVVKSVDYSPAAMITGDPLKGCIRLKYIPDYSGTPSGNRYMVMSTKEATSNNFVCIFHNGLGDLLLNIRNPTGGNIVNMSRPWAPVEGVTYEIEAHWDILTGDNRIYVDGIQLGATDTSTGTKTFTDMDFIRIGNNANSSNDNDCFIWDVQLFSEPQHFVNFSSEIPRTIALENYADATLQSTESLSVGEVKAASLAFSATGSDSVTLSAVDSAGASYAVLGAPLGFLPDDTYTFEVDLTSFDGTTTPEFDFFDLEYVPANEVEYVRVYGFFRDGQSVPASKKIVAKSSSPISVAGTSMSVNEVKADFNSGFDSRGYFYLDLPKTLPGIKYQVTESWEDSRGESQTRSYDIEVSSSGYLNITSIIS